MDVTEWIFTIVAIFFAICFLLRWSKLAATTAILLAIGVIILTINRKNNMEDTTLFLWTGIIASSATLLSFPIIFLIEEETHTETWLHKIGDAIRVDVEEHETCYGFILQLVCIGLSFAFIWWRPLAYIFSAGLIIFNIARIFLDLDDEWLG